MVTDLETVVTAVGPLLDVPAPIENTVTPCRSTVLLTGGRKTGRKEEGEGGRMEKGGWGGRGLGREEQGGRGREEGGRNEEGEGGRRNREGR